MSHSMIESRPASVLSLWLAIKILQFVMWKQVEEPDNTAHNSDCEDQSICPILVVLAQEADEPGSSQDMYTCV